MRYPDGFPAGCIEAYAAMHAGKPLKPYHDAPEVPGMPEVKVGITNGGLCHSDLHLHDNDSGFSSCPLVPGHEIIGHITQKGNSVRDLEPGQRVGIGGPGHLALQYGRAPGCQVTALSSSPAREAEARQFGADAFVATSAQGTLAEHTHTYELLLSAVSGVRGWIMQRGFLHGLERPVWSCKVGLRRLSSPRRRAWQLQTGASAPCKEVCIIAEHTPVSADVFWLERLRNNRVRYRAVLTNEEGENYRVGRS
jgi:hypothetical protein